MNAQCACGKRMVVSDALVGKTVRCPSCGNSVLVALILPSQNLPRKTKCLKFLDFGNCVAQTARFSEWNVAVITRIPCLSW